MTITVKRNGGTLERKVIGDIRHATSVAAGLTASVVGSSQTDSFVN